LKKANLFIYWVYHNHKHKIVIQVKIKYLESISHSKYT